MACNSHSRTSFYEQIYLLFSLPVIIMLYVLLVRGTLRAVRPALLYMIPQLKGRAFFDHAAHDRTNALTIDVSLPCATPTLSWLLARTRWKNTHASAGCHWPYRGTWPIGAKPSHLYHHLQRVR